LVKRSLVLVFVLSVCGCGTTKTVTKTVTRTVPSNATAKTQVGPPAEQVQFGYIRSLVRRGAQYLL
jgi:hypothetical protein